MAMSSGAIEEAPPYINITPLIDILLVLLIIFMVISPLKPTRFEAKVPAEPQKTSTPPRPNPLSLIVDVGLDGKIKLNKQEIGDSGALSAQLAELFKQREQNGVYKEGTRDIEKTVFIKAPRALKYGEVVRVLDAVKGAGATPVGLQVDDLQ
jgi:biopolymer transport protein ExbD